MFPQKSNFSCSHKKSQGVVFENYSKNYRGFLNSAVKLGPIE